MKTPRRLLCALLAAVLALAAGGCSGRSFYQALGDTLNAQNAGEGRFPQDIWRADLDYAEMEYAPYDLADFAAVTDPIYGLAENGGTQDEFDEADFLLWDEMSRVYTLYILASNMSYTDAADEALAGEAARALEVYYGAYDEFMLALRAMALSEHAELMESGYSRSLIDAVSAYEPSTGEQDALTTRENALISRYYAEAARETPDEAALGEIFVELVEVRNAIAAAAGYESYAEYAYGTLYSKDYTPEDARAVWDGAREHIAPLIWRYAGEITDRAGALEADGSFDCSEESVLRALGDGAERLSGDLYAAWRYLTDHRLYDISVSAKKAEVGFTTFMPYYNEPYIFNASYGTFYDYLDMMHEFGHFVNYFYCPESAVFSMPDNDLSELQSQGMTVVMTALFDDLFGKERGDVMRDEALLELAFSVIDGALYDEFQQRVYAEEDLTPERASQIYAGLYTEYGYSPYDGYETEWLYVSHNFDSPFYYISYAVSAVGALEINALLQDDFEAGLDKYLEVPRTGTTPRPFGRRASGTYSTTPPTAPPPTR